MHTATTITKGKKTYTIEPYDVLQIKCRERWEDYTTLRTESEMRTAVGMCLGGGGYRIIRGGHKTVVCP